MDEVEGHDDEIRSKCQAQKETGKGLREQKIHYK